MSWIPAPLLAPADYRTPVTVCLTAAQAAELERMLGTLRNIDPDSDDNDVVDRIFATGLSIEGAALKEIAP